MTRPDTRAFRRLPLLEPRRAALENCVFCPKLCRSECPVSNVAATETLTPWGKMSMAYFVANESVPAAVSYGAPVWACTGCHACKSACDHKNDVAGTLLQARAGTVGLGIGDARARELSTRLDAHLKAHTARSLGLAARTSCRSSSPTKLLVGCTYGSKAPEAAESVVRVARRLLGDVELVHECCGSPLLHAGDAAGFARQREALRRSVGDARRLVVGDPGCAITVRDHHAQGDAPLMRAELLIEILHRELSRLAPIPDAPRVRWHDPCQLGRGLGLYDEPRAILTRILGRPPREFTYARSRAGCSGAGGLLPVTMPDVSRAITDARVAAHDGEALPIVTACASSLASFRRSGSGADDLMTWALRSLDRDGA